ncbi:type IV pilus secretin PilQ [Acidobacteria bacterium AH-259-G07]|nr:type IV pilus secretin PilQ [Acidobacteria bacterium AH-259-G07]
MSSRKNPFLKKGLSPLLCLIIGCSSSLYAASLSPETSAPVKSPVAQESPFEGEPVSLKVVGISVVDFFRTISELSGLNFLIDPDVSGSLTLNVEQVPWDQLFDAVLQSQGLAKKIEGNLVRISTRVKLKQEQQEEQELKQARLEAVDTVTLSRRLNYATGSEIMPTLQPHLSGRGAMNVDSRTNTLIITDVPSGLEKVTGLLEILDVAEKQVEIEARIIEASTNFARALGAQLGFGVGARSFDQLVDPPEILSEVGPGARRLGGFLGSMVNNPAPGGTTIAGISMGSLLDTVRLDAIITAGEREGEAQILSKPRVTAQNNAEATIVQGSRIPVPVQQNFTTTVQFQTAALQLTVTPRVTNVQTILLNIRVENNIPDFSRTVLGIPAIQTSESATQVLVPDGGTTVIGGIFIESKTEQEDRVPGLGKIPVLGHLFKTQSRSRDTREIIFFITARIKQ